MDNIGKSFSDLIYNNILFKKLLPAFPRFAFPIFHSFLSNKIVISFLPSVSVVIIAFLSLVALFLIRLFFQLQKSLHEPSVLLELTPPAFIEKTSYTTSRFFSAMHHLGKRRTLMDKILGRKILISLEIVSTKEKGIRYLIRTTPKEVNNVKRIALSYLPQLRVSIVEDYLPAASHTLPTKISEYTLSKHYALPLQKQNMLEEHDPLAYITGMMTKLSPGELISLQIVLSPIKVSEKHKISKMILRNEDVLGYLNKFQLPVWMKPVVFTLTLGTKLIHVVGKEMQWAVTELAHQNSSTVALAYQSQIQNQLQLTNAKPARVLSTFEQGAVLAVQEKIKQPLFEASVRVLSMMQDKDALEERMNGLTSALSIFSVPEYQSLDAKSNFPSVILDKMRRVTFKQRLLSLILNSSSSLLSASEVSDLYHFPFAQVTQTEDIVKIHSRELPAPLTLKQGKKLSVIFGKNTFGGTTTPIGLTEEERKTHMYIIGRTGSGKTTLLFSMAKHDIEHNEGLAFMDPHGDVSLDLLACIPEERKDDLIYFNPFDLKHPIGINLLELTPGLDEDEAELEKEVVCEGVVSLFRKVFSKEENANAHRIEYILRNTVHTAFTVKDATIFTVYDLLNNPPFQQQVVAKLQNEDLKNFWKFEFGRAGDYQIVKMTGGVTAKIGRFLFSPTARRILEQKHSTINFSDILNGKILICNFSQGKLGEDTTRLLGTTILTKLQQAALKRAYIPQNQRKQFHLYVDEFQNFATLSFAKMLSEARKYGLEVYMVEQSTSQQQDRSIVNIVMANATCIVAFRTGNSLDEQVLLPQFAPYLKEGEIINLPKYRFYIKISANESEDPFSGETIFTPVVPDPEKIDRLLEASRKNNAITYVKKVKNLDQPTTSGNDNSGANNEETIKKGPGLPKLKRK